MVYEAQTGHLGGAFSQETCQHAAGAPGAWEGAWSICAGPLGHDITIGVGMALFQRIHSKKPSAIPLFPPAPQTAGYTKYWETVRSIQGRYGRVLWCLPSIDLGRLLLIS